ncbi:hypothetical protein PUV47_01410 [Pseudovibrio exalbescens]|uniref:hypothetical protein n=1 Tax=Pseudovibrio exalbescens TaxID=197461 RepID=UPI0023653780|nr:hypothetical protein [Pseudovibrio exalbescens]MDD7908559.1 hypothetical protein [Pseudovibrio exalbescens]
MSSWTKPCSYSAILEAIVAQIGASDVLSRNGLVKSAPGIVSDAWLKKEKVPNSGGAFVGLGRVSSVKQLADGTSVHELGLGVFLVPPYRRRDGQAASIADTAHRLIELIDDNRFELAKAQRPVGISARNLYSPSVDLLGSALWLIEWRQSFILFDAEGNDIGNAASRSAALGRG